MRLTQLFKATMYYDAEFILSHGSLFTMNVENAVDNMAHVAYICDEHVDVAIFDFASNELMGQYVAEVIGARGLAAEGYVDAWTADDEQNLTRLLASEFGADDTDPETYEHYSPDDEWDV